MKSKILFFILSQLLNCCFLFSQEIEDTADNTKKIDTSYQLTSTIVSFEETFNYDEFLRVKSIAQNGEAGAPAQMVEYKYEFSQVNGKAGTKVIETVKGDAATGDYVTEYMQTLDGNRKEIVLNGKKITSQFKYGGGNGGVNGEPGEFNVELVDSNGFKLKTHSKLKSEEVTYENINGDILEKVTTTRNNLLLTSSVETNTDSVLISHNKDNQVDTIFSQGTGITTFEYNLVGLNTNVTLPNGQKQNFGYNEKNQLTNATGYGLLDFSLEYTASGQNNKLKTQREEGNLDSVQVTEFKTDEVTDLFTEKLIENQSTGIVEYENNLRIKSFTDANLNKTTIDYYINGTLKNLLTNGPKGIRNLTYTYDALGRTNSINDSQFGLFAYKYNIEGQVTEEQFGNFKNEYDYTADYNFQKHRLKKSGATISETEIQLDPDGKLQKIINGDITKEFFYVPDTFFVEKEVISKNALPVLTKIYEIDDKKRVEGIQYKNNFDFAIHHNKFNFDNLNRYIGIDEIVANKSHVFDYGNKAHLENATYTKNSSPTNYFTYQYDNIGNRKESSDNEHKTKQVYVSNNLNQYQISVVNNEVMVCGNADVDVHVTVNGMPVIRNGTEFIAYLLLPSLSALVEVVMPIQVIGVRDSVSESTEKFAKIEGNLVVHSGQASFQYDAMGHVISSDRCLYERDETGSIRVIEPKLVIATTPQLNSKLDLTINNSGNFQGNLRLDRLYSPKPINYIAITDEDNNNTNYEAYYYLKANPTDLLALSGVTRKLENGIVILEFPQVIADGFVVIETSGTTQMTEMSCGLKENKRAAPGIKAEYGYDHVGRRISKKLYNPVGVGWATTPFETKKFVYDGWNLIAELDGNDNVQKTFVWGVDELLAIKVGSTTYLPITENRNIVKLINATTGLIDAEYEYSPFGVLLSETGIAKEVSPYRYKTEYFDNESGLYYFGYRFYDPANGRWLSREPLGEGASLNLYMYCHNDPINRYDRLGLDDVIYQKIADNKYIGYIRYNKWEQRYLGKPEKEKIEGWIQTYMNAPDIEIDKRQLLTRYGLTDEERALQKKLFYDNDILNFDKPKIVRDWATGRDEITSVRIHSPGALKTLQYASVAGMAISGYGMIGASSIILRIGGGFLLVNSFDEAIVIESGNSLLVSGLENLGVSHENALRGKLAANIASIPISLAPAFIATPGLIGKLGTPFKITEDIPIITAKDLISGKPLHGILDESIQGTKIFGFFEGKPVYRMGGGSGKNYIYHLTDDVGMKAITAQKDITIKASVPSGGNPFGAYFSKVDPALMGKDTAHLLRIDASKTKWIFKIQVEDFGLFLEKGGSHRYIIYTKKDLVVPKPFWELELNPKFKK